MKCKPAPLPSPEVLDINALAQAYLDGEIDLFVVLGPTASGKTKFAVKLAKELSLAVEKISSGAAESFEHSGSSSANAPCGANAVGEFSAERLSIANAACGAEIISADSRQVYRRMDIGTGKDLAEYGEVPYHLIDIAEPGTQYNVFEFQKDFASAWADIRSRNRIPILCGGTGLYISAVTAGYDFKSKQALSSEKPISSRDDLPHKPFFIGTLVSRELRNSRIDLRLDARLKEGMIEEIQALLDSGIPSETLISYGLEYKFVTLYLLGELSYEEMRTQLATAIHQFAKRQMTWFRGMERGGVKISWVEDIISFCNIPSLRTNLAEAIINFEN